MKKQLAAKIAGLWLAVFLLIQGSATAIGNHWLPGQKIPVLLFHEVGNGEADRFLPRNDFVWMMDYLKKNQFHALTLDQYMDIRNGRVPAPAKPVVITFDDGEESVYSISYPILKERKLPAAVFLISGFIGNTLYHTLEDRTYQKKFSRAPGKTVWKFHMLDWGQIREMGNFGFAFHAHSKTHAPLAYLDAKSLVPEIAGSKEEIETHVGTRVRYFAYPWGEFNETVKNSLKKYGFEAGFATEIQDPRLRKEGDPFTIERYEITPFTKRRDFKITVWGLMPYKENTIRVLKKIPFYQPLKTWILRGEGNHA